MTRSSLFLRLIGDMRLANESHLSGISVEEALQRREEARLLLKRREFVGGMAGATAVAAFPGLAYAGKSTGLDVGIVGAGLAGLVCGTQLKRAGVEANLYDAADRAGGRCWSMTNFNAAGQVIERGGELIDNLHKTMIAYAREFGCTLEDVNKNHGEVVYYFGGKSYSETQIVTEYRAFVEGMRADLTKLSGGPTAGAFNEHDRLVDNTSLADYLDGKNAAGIKAGPIARAAIANCYLAEFGLPIEQQSALNFLMFIHADKRNRFQPWGVFSDERYHVVEGNDRIAQGLASQLAGQIALGMRLERVAKTAAGKIELSFKQGTKRVVKTHDQVVLTLPFSVLRGVELDASLGLSAQKTAAIREIGYGNNAKMMVGFKSQPWKAIGSGGATYSDLTNHQCTWQTNPSKGSATNAVITDYASGDRGLRLQSKNQQAEALRFLVDFDKVIPGATDAAATNSDGTLLVHLEAWPNNPLTKGSYTCYKPGQFTQIAGIEGQSAGNLHFAGEHTNSFYEWQGFMEGACLSGIVAAGGVLARR